MLWMKDLLFVSQNKLLFVQRGQGISHHQTISIQICLFSFIFNKNWSTLANSGTVSIPNMLFH